MDLESKLVEMEMAEEVAAEGVDQSESQNKDIDQSENQNKDIDQSEDLPQDIDQLEDQDRPLSAADKPEPSAGMYKVQHTLSYSKKSMVTVVSSDGGIQLSFGRSRKREKSPEQVRIMQFYSRGIFSSIERPDSSTPGYTMLVFKVV